MTDEERDELLIRMDERLKCLDLQLRVILRNMFGYNGKPGLCQRLQSLEEERRSAARYGGAAAALIGFLVNAAVAAYAAFFKN